MHRKNQRHSDLTNKRSVFTPENTRATPYDDCGGVQMHRKNQLRPDEGLILQQNTQ